jgi:exonuclease SbcC
VEGLERDAAVEEKKSRDAEMTLARGDETRRLLEEELRTLDRRIEALGGDPERRTALVDARPRAEQLAGVREQIERLDRAAQTTRASLEKQVSVRAEAQAAVPKAEEARREAEAAVKTAREEQETAHRQHAAVALRRGLAVGEPCPVCEQRVPKVPKGRAPAVAAAEKTVAAAEAAQRGAAAAVEEARLALQKAETSAAGSEREVARLEEEREGLVASARSLEETLRDAGFDDADLADPPLLMKGLQAELKSLESARQEKTEIETKRRAVDERRTGLEAERAAAAARRDEAASRLEEIAARRGEASGALERAAPALLDLASREGWGGLGDPPGERDEVHVLEERRAAAQGESRDVAARLGALQGEVERLGKKIVRAAELRERKVALDADGALLKTLSDHLRANELVAWIQEEALRRLAEDGSRHLALLSQGRYGLRLGSGETAVAGSRAEQDFFVVDHWNADGVRSVRTLSGGETFLASLALALALAESLARLSAGGQAVQALESLFLDEGFGTLDGESLDTVVSALDALHGGQRLVGIVTHVRELAERMPARLEVRRSGRTASAVVT